MVFGVIGQNLGRLPRVLVMLLVSLMASSCMILGPDSQEEEAQPAKSAVTTTRDFLRGTFVKNTDRQVRVRLPRGWEMAPSNALHSNADLYAYHPDKKIYFLALGEANGNLKFTTLEENAADYRRILMTQLQPPVTEEKTELTQVGEFPAVQYLVRGTVGGTPIVYLHTTVATKGSHYQLVAWTAADRYEDNRDDMQAIIDSFQPI